MSSSFSGTPPLPEHLKDYLAALRLQAPFQQLLALYPRRQLPRYRPQAGPQAHETWIFNSGVQDGEDALLHFLTGKDPDD